MLSHSLVKIPVSNLSNTLRRPETVALVSALESFFSHNIVKFPIRTQVGEYEHHHRLPNVL